jgi:hypothetical protein
MLRPVASTLPPRFPAFGTGTTACGADLSGREVVPGGQDAGVVVARYPAPTSEAALVQVAGLIVAAQCSCGGVRFQDGGGAGRRPLAQSCISLKVA